MRRRSFLACNPYLHRLGGLSRSRQASAAFFAEQAARAQLQRRLCQYQGWEEWQTLLSLVLHTTARHWKTTRTSLRSCRSEILTKNVSGRPSSLPRQHQIRNTSTRPSDSGSNALVIHIWIMKTKSHAMVTGLVFTTAARGVAEVMMLSALSARGQVGELLSSPCRMYFAEPPTLSPASVRGGDCQPRLLRPLWRY